MTSASPLPLPLNLPNLPLKEALMDTPLNVDLNAGLNTLNDATALPLELLLRMHKAMVGIRAWDERALKLQRSGRISFCVTSQGEEATQIGTAAALEAEDWIFPSYRQYGVALWRGATLEGLAHQLFGTAKDVSKGRQMPCHFSFASVNFVSISSVIGTQIVQAVGTAMGMNIKDEKKVSVVYFGDGATSANDFHSGLNMAGVYKAPVVFVCINNQFAISLPVEQQTASETIAQKASAYGFPGFRVDGNDIVGVYKAMQQAVAHARSGAGPVLLELLTFRLDPHSSSDDPGRYRPSELEKAWRQRDPIRLLEGRLIDDYGQSPALLEVHWKLAAEEALAAAKIAEETPKPDLSTLFDDVLETPFLSLEEDRANCLAYETGVDLPGPGEFPL
jgi:pyruvate dehydrogenase E1 component alpha subunit